jgi:hypothetical protein
MGNRPIKPIYNKRPPRKISVDSNIVDAKGRKTVFPNSVNRISPGKRPIPNFSSHGNAAEKMTSARKIVRVQRIMHCLRMGMKDGCAAAHYYQGPVYEA